MIQKTIHIQGMSCNHCVMAVERELKKLPLSNLSVQIGSASFTFEESKISDKEIQNAVEDAGYTIVK